MDHNDALKTTETIESLFFFSANIAEREKILPKTGGNKSQITHCGRLVLLDETMDYDKSQLMIFAMCCFSNEMYNELLFCEPLKIVACDWNREGNLH